MICATRVKREIAFDFLLHYLFSYYVSCEDNTNISPGRRLSDFLLRCLFVVSLEYGRKPTLLERLADRALPIVYDCFGQTADTHFLKPQILHSHLVSSPMGSEQKSVRKDGLNSTLARRQSFTSFIHVRLAGQRRSILPGTKILRDLHPSDQFETLGSTL